MAATAIDYPRAKSLWAAATGEGSENATTTFHTEWNKNRSSERPYALGYLTQRRFVRFLQSSQGQALLGVDCSRAGAGGGERENFIRTVCSEFFALCVELSKLNEVQVDDYELVGTARNMADGSYCTFPGFASALHSPRFHKMLKQWRKNAIEAPEPIPETTPKVVVGVPVEPASEPPPPPPSPAPKPVPKPVPRRNPNPVVDMDSSDEETTIPKYAPPPPLPLDPVTRIARKLYKEGMTNAYHRESREWTASNSGAVEFYTIDEWIEPRWQRMPPDAREEWMKAARATLNESVPPPAAPPAPAPSVPAPPAPPPAPPPPTPVVKPAPEPIVEPEPDAPKPVVPEPAAPEPAAPEPVEAAPKIAPKSKKKRKRNDDDDKDTCTIAGTEHWPTNALGFLLIQKYNAHKARAARGDLAFDDKHECRAEVWGDYTFLLTQRQMGRSALKTDGYVLLDGEAASRVVHATRSQPRLRSVPDIVRHFNANPDLNEDVRA